MGYTTYYCVDIVDVPPKSMDTLFSKFEIMMDDAWENSSTSASGNYCGKWYDWEKDLIDLSSEFPDVFITVDGDGEESDDIWRAYIKDGAIQFAAARIVYDEYDPAKMREVNPPKLGQKPVVEDLI